MSIQWKSIATFEISGKDLAAPWVVVPDDLGDVTHLQIKGEGKWSLLPGMPECGADGVAGLRLKDDDLVIPNCPAGALIGRLGGSSANGANQTASAPLSPNNESKPFPIGTICTIALPANGVFGSLFVGFNTIIRPVSVTTLRVSISGVKLPPPPPATPI